MLPMQGTIPGQEIKIPHAVRRGQKKRCGIYTMEYYSAIIKNALMPFAATWMDLEIIILSKVSQTGKDKYYMWNLKYDTNEHIYETKTDSQT